MVTKGALTFTTKPYYMKRKFGWLSQVQLGLMSLLPMVMGTTCKRNAPRYEPDPLICDRASSTMGSSSCIQKPNTNIANGLQPYDSRLDQLIKHYYRDSQSVKNLLADIEYKKSLILNIAPPADQSLQSDFSILIKDSLTTVSNDDKDQSSRPTSNSLPHTLSVFFERNRKDGTWYKGRLVGVESITIRSNPVLPNSEKHVYSLVGFLVPIPKNPKNNNDSYIAFVQNDQQWYFYNNDSAKNDNTKTALPTKDAIYLASKKGTNFFYQKIK